MVTSKLLGQPSKNGTDWYLVHGDEQYFNNLQKPEELNCAGIELHYTLPFKAYIIFGSLAALWWII